MLEVYNMPSCPLCERTKTMLSSYKIPYISYTIGVDVEREFVVRTFPNNNKAPIIVEDGQLIGGWMEFLEWLAVKEVVKHDE